MTSRSLLKWSLGLALGVLPLAGGCQQDDPSSPSPVLTAVAGATTAQPQQSGISAPGESDADTADVSLDQLAEAPVTPLSTEQSAPPNIRPNSPVAEMVKLANSGVDQSVMLAFVTNSPNTFNLTADEIIYLNDIGVPGTVVTSMLQHDQEFAAMHPNNPPPSVPPAPVAPPPDNTATAPPPVEAPLTPPAEADYPQFYNSLSPYGNWVDVAGYGPVWQPTVVVVNSGWQPYFDCGHWAYTDCGWYWASDYSWGWAPFHYGRWFRHNRLGWCWAPGRVWGPSWVSWRYSDDYCGWAPLPPGVSFSFGFGLGFRGHHFRDWDDCGLRAAHFRFVPWHAFNDHHLHGFAADSRHGDEIFHRSAPVNRMVANHNTVVNHGISAARVAAATHRVVEPVKLRDAGMSAPQGGRREQFDSRTRTMSVYRPQIAPARNTTASSPGRTGFSPSRTVTTTAATASGQRVTQTPSTRSSATPTRSGAGAPLVLRGQEQVSARPSAPAQPPSSSLVIIGRQQNGRSVAPARGAAPTPSTSASPQPMLADRNAGVANQRSSSEVVRVPDRSAAASSQSARPAWNNSRTATAVPSTTPQPTPRANPSQATPWLNSRSAAPAPSVSSRPAAPPAYSAPVRSTPTPNYAPAPSVQRSYSAPAPAYRPQPSPSYSAPAPAPRSAPAPSYSGGSAAPSRSAPSSPPASSSSGGRSSSGGTGRR